MHLPWVESLGRFLFVQSLGIPKILPRKFHGALYIQEAPLAPPALGSVKMLFSIPPLPFGSFGYTLAWLSYALGCIGYPLAAMGYYATSYGKYTLTHLNLSYPFVYLGLFLGIALALMHYAAPTLCNIVHMLDALCAYTLYML
jgi:hypothetical protein